MQLVSKISPQPETIAQQGIGENCRKNHKSFCNNGNFLVVFYEFGMIFAERERERERMTNILLQTV